MSQPISLSKPKITFELPLGTKKAQELLVVTNNDFKYRFFKIMSTAKCRYIVRPSHGRLPPIGRIQIEILLSLSEGDSDLTNFKDQFVIYTVVATEDLAEKREIDEYIQRNKANVQKTMFSVSVQIQETPTMSIRSGGLHSNLTNSIRESMEPGDSLESQAYQTVKSKFSLESIMPTHNSVRNSMKLGDLSFKKDSGSAIIKNPLDRPSRAEKLTESIYEAREAKEPLRKDSRKQDSSEIPRVDKDSTAELIANLQQQNLMLESELKMIRVW
jgi:hypothetical protein